MDTYLFDKLRISFIRAHIEASTSTPITESSSTPPSMTTVAQILEQLFNDTKIALDGSQCTPNEHYARLCPLLTNMIIMFIEDVGMIKLWPIVLHDFRMIANRDTTHDTLDILRKHLNLWIRARPWIPIIRAINLFNSELEPCVAPVAEMIIRGDFMSIAHATFSDIRECVREHEHDREAININEMCDFAQMTGICGAARQLQQFATFMVLCQTHDTCDTSAIRVSRAMIRAPKDVRKHLELVTCYLIRDSYQYFQSFAPSEFIARIVDIARGRLGDITIAEEKVLDALVIAAPIRAIPSDTITIECRTIATMQVLLQLARGTFIGFDGVRRAFIHGPISAQLARTCINIANIANCLSVPRDNRNYRIVKSSNGSLFFVTEANMITIPTNLLSASQVVAMLRRDNSTRSQMRIFIENCIWRAIMNFPGPSITAGIVVCDNGESIYSYGECAIGTQVDLKSVPRAVLDVFANDSRYYCDKIQTWANKLRNMLSIECAARLRDPSREHMTGISTVSLSKCVARAAQIADVWLSQLKKNEYNISNL